VYTEICTVIRCCIDVTLCIRVSHFYVFVVCKWLPGTVCIARGGRLTFFVGAYSFVCCQCNVHLDVGRICVRWYLERSDTKCSITASNCWHIQFAELGECQELREQASSQYSPKPSTLGDAICVSKGTGFLRHMQRTTGWPKNWHYFVRLNIMRLNFIKYWPISSIRRTFVIVLSRKIPPHLKCVATVRCEMSMS